MQRRDQAVLAALVIGLLIGAGATYTLAVSQGRTSTSTTTVISASTTTTASTGNVTSSSVGAASAIVSAECPHAYNTSAYPDVNKLRLIPASTNSMKVSAAPTGSSQVTWCVYNPSGVVESSYQTDRVLSSVAAAADGSGLAAVGWQTLPVPGGEYANGAAYFFDQGGRMIWNITSSQPFFEVEADANDSVMVVSDPGMLYVNHGGQILWNYSGFMSNSVVLVNNGSDVVAGVDQILFPGHTDYGSALTMFNSKGTVLWNDTFPDYFFGSTGSLAYSAGHIVAGFSVDYPVCNAPDGCGNLTYYNLQGGLVWSRQIASAIQAVAFEDGGSAIMAQTNLGWNMTFSLSGNLISNQTALP